LVLAASGVHSVVVPLTRLCASLAMLADLKGPLVWLHQEVVAAIRHGTDHAALQQAHLLLPGLLAGNPTRTFPTSCCAKSH